MAAAPEGLLARLQAAVAAHRLWTPQARVLVAVSGGADSVALLHALLALQGVFRLSLRIAHLDHGLRPESADDAEFVRELGRRFRIPSTVERHPVGARCAREGWSLEDGARRIRYQFLLEAARRHSASRIALAHTADDQAETVLMRLVRGTGLMGLSAIPVSRRLADGVTVVRPLLEVWRREVLAYLRGEGLTHREDATNADHRFMRNRIRHELLPLLERDYNPNIKGALTQLAEASRWDYAYLQEAAERQWRRMAKARAGAPGAVTIALAALRRQPRALQRQVVHEAIRRVRGEAGRLEFRHWLEVERLCRACPAGACLDLPGGIRLRREVARLVVEGTLRITDDSRYTDGLMMEPQ
ncbi:MAG: tRNA lysidine(34) synthetase TilS [Candidatus Omnitrophica bacterium]|nr:tRNA lysidine(34) synthetase TilS [Candidatus Omnitrophota bacterium]